MQMPSWYITDGYSTLYMYNISNSKTKILITVTTNLLINSNDIFISEYTNVMNAGYTLVPDKRTAMYLGYDIYYNTTNKSNLVNIVKPKKLLSNNNTLVIGATSRNKIIDIDNDIIITVSSSGVIQCTKENSNITASAIDSGSSKRFLIKGLSDNIIAAYEYYVPLFVDDNNTGNEVTLPKDYYPNSVFPQLTMEIAKEINSRNNGSISATINGVQFDGKTNITTPATKLITPVHINGIEFDGSQDITIPAPTNALTLGGLDSGQFIKVTDVGNAAGKIPRFDNDGFLVYPDGSKERIENG